MTILFNFILQLLCSTKEQEITTICRFLRIESSIFLNTKNFDCDICKKQEKIVKNEDIKNECSYWINPFVFPKITSEEFGCSDLTYTFQLSALKRLLIDFICVLSIDHKNGRFPTDSMEDLNSASNESILQSIENLHLLIVNYCGIKHRTNDLKRYNTLVAEIIESVCFSKESNLLIGNITSLRIKYLEILEAPGLFELIINKINNLGAKVDLFPEIRWLILKTFLDLHHHKDAVILCRLLNLLSFCYILDFSYGTKLVSEDGKEHILYRNSITLLKYCIRDCMDEEDTTILETLRHILCNLEVVFGVNNICTKSKILFRSYFFFFANNETFLIKYNKYLNGLRESKNLSVYLERKHDETIYSIFITLNHIYKFILEDFAGFERMKLEKESQNEKKVKLLGGCEKLIVKGF